MPLAFHSAYPTRLPPCYLRSMELQVLNGSEGAAGWAGSLNFFAYRPRAPLFEWRLPGCSTNWLKSQGDGPVVEAASRHPRCLRARPGFVQNRPLDRSAYSRERIWNGSTPLIGKANHQDCQFLQIQRVQLLLPIPDHGYGRPRVVPSY